MSNYPGDTADLANIRSTELPDLDDSATAALERPTPHPDCTIDRNHGAHYLPSALVIAEHCDGKREPFVPDYVALADTRIYRKRLYPNAGGVATATFRGAADSLWIERGTSGRLSVYSEVTLPADDEQPLETVLRIAVVPTGKRIPKSGVRLHGGGKGLHAYLLERETRVAEVDDLDTATDAAADAATMLGDTTDTATAGQPDIA